MNIRTVIIIYAAAFIAGAVYKFLLYLFQPDSFTHINTVIAELTIVSAIVTAVISIFYMLRLKKKQDEKNP
ncbi:MAG: hypothetical protein R6V27_12490 [Balneolaceae bacterium]